MTVTYRAGNKSDLDFIVWVETIDEGVSTPSHLMSSSQHEIHRAYISSFIDSDDKGSFVCCEADEPIGLILWRYRNRLTEELPVWSVFNRIDADRFPSDGAFCEIYQLWVDPKFRRQGIGSRLKIIAEEHAMEGGIRMMYTHTEVANGHVITLNEKLGYREVRRGPIWDEIERVSLVKYL
ncbi:MAG TPA: GNAT family N-acetyltransferase [Candidatus Kapabacteria bacterium]|nr:GNAT family N-acetyltransferase [Candidatus Kapabacteria bacterium]